MTTIQEKNAYKRVEKLREKVRKGEASQKEIDYLHDWDHVEAGTGKEDK